MPKSKQEKKSENIPTWVDDFRKEMSQTIKETMKSMIDKSMKLIGADIQKYFKWTEDEIKVINTKAKNLENDVQRRDSNL